MKRRMLMGLTGVALGLMAAGVMAQGKLSGDMVKIGVMTDMSGVYADLGGQGSIVAAQMAIDDFGGKVLGKPIQLVSADHQNKPDLAAAKAREWIDRDGVDMITDLLNSGVSLAVSGVAKDKNKVAMVVGAATSALTNANCNANTVHYAYDTYALANIAGSAIVKQGNDSWYFLTADYAFGAALEKDTTDVIKANGGKVLGTSKHPLNTASLPPDPSAPPAPLTMFPTTPAGTIHQLIVAPTSSGLSKADRSWPRCWCSSPTSTPWGWKPRRA